MPLKGRVVGYVDGKKLGEGSCLIPIIESTWEGDRKFIRSPVGSLHPLYSIGEEVPLTVSRTVPPRVALYSHALYYLSLGFMLLGVLAAALFFVTFRYDAFSLLMALVVIGYLARRAKGKSVSRASFSQWNTLLESALARQWMEPEVVEKLSYLPPSFIQGKLQRHHVAMKAWGVTMLLTSFGGMYFGEFWLERRVEFVKAATRTQGYVVELDAKSDSDGILYTPVIAFRVPASKEEIRFRHPISSNPPSYRTGVKST